eukprot:318798_1
MPYVSYIKINSIPYRIINMISLHINNSFHNISLSLIRKLFPADFNINLIVQFITIVVDIQYFIIIQYSCMLIIYTKLVLFVNVTKSICVSADIFPISFNVKSNRRSATVFLFFREGGTIDGSVSVCHSLRLRFL